MTGLDVSGIDLKLDRAEQNLQTINIEAGAFAKGNFNLVSVTEPQGAKEWTVYKWGDAVRPPNPMWGVYVGEFAHNARSALNQILWLLVLDNGQKPGKHTQFPIYERRGDWRNEVTERDPKRGPACTEGVSDEVFAVIDGSQPYRCTNNAERAAYCLTRLDRISNTDKHQTLHATRFGSVGDLSLRYIPDGFVEVSKFRQGVGARNFEAGAEIGRALIHWAHTPPPDTHVYVGLNGTAHVLFGDANREFSLLDLLGVLAGIRTLVALLAQHAG